MAEPQPSYAARAEAWLAARLRDLLNPRMGAWLVLTLALGAFLYFVAGRASAIGSLAVTVFNMSALGYLGYRAANALERGRRPHLLFEEAAQLRALEPDKSGMRGVSEEFRYDAERREQEANRERAWQLEQLANAMLVRRVTLVSACVLGATFMKF